MNKKRILAVADAIEAHDAQFNMASIGRPDIASTAGTECGTPGCIVGFTRALWPRTASNSYEFAADTLGLDDPIAVGLFAPEPEDTGFFYGADYSDPEFISAPHAVACLRNLVETGEVDWEGTKPT